MNVQHLSALDAALLAFIDARGGRALLASLVSWFAEHGQDEATALAVLSRLCVARALVLLPDVSTYARLSALDLPELARWATWQRCHTAAQEIRTGSPARLAHLAERWSAAEPSGLQAMLYANAARCAAESRPFRVVAFRSAGFSEVETRHASEAAARAAWLCAAGSALTTCATLDVINGRSLAAWMRDGEGFADCTETHRAEVEALCSTLVHGARRATVRDDPMGWAVVFTGSPSGDRECFGPARTVESIREAWLSYASEEQAA